MRTLLADPNLDLDALRDELEGIEPGVLAEERQAYYERIVTSRLYAALSTEAQRVASRLALSPLPLSVDAVAALADLDEQGARVAIWTPASTTVCCNASTPPIYPACFSRRACCDRG